MSIKQKETLLFEKWKQKRPKLVSDGLVDETSYLKSNLKIVLLLKEVNSADSDWDLCDFIRKKAKDKYTWGKVSRWIYGIRNIEKDFGWKELQDISESYRQEMLNSIGVVNVKKEPGGHTSIKKTVAQYYKEDKDLILEQLSLYDADIIICCGESVGCPIKITDWEVTSRGVSYGRKGKQIVISYSHPVARCADYLLYYGLIDAVREILAITE